MSNYPNLPPQIDWRVVADRTERDRRIQEIIDRIQNSLDQMKNKVEPTIKHPEYGYPYCSGAAQEQLRIVVRDLKSLVE